MAKHPNYIKNQVAPYQTIRNRAEQAKHHRPSGNYSAGSAGPVAPPVTAPVAPPAAPPVAPAIPAPAAPTFHIPLPPGVTTTIPMAPRRHVIQDIDREPQNVPLPPSEPTSPMEALTDIPGAPVSPEWQEYLTYNPSSVPATRPVSPSATTSPTKRMKTSLTTFATPVDTPIAEGSQLPPLELEFEPHNPENIAVACYLATLESEEEQNPKASLQRYLDHHPGVAW